MNAIWRCILLFVLLIGIVPVAVADPELSISANYILDSERVRRNSTVLKFKGVVTNSGDLTALGAIGTVTSSDPQVEVRDDRLRIGNIGNGVTQITDDTFKIRIPNGYTFDPSVLSWTFTFRRAIDNPPPIADAGNDATVFVDQLVMLDGSGSTDPDGGTLRYDWEFISVPSGSAVALAGGNSIMPSFTVDVVGDYVVQLIVRDNRSFSAPDTVTITTINSTPVADAGPDQNVLAGSLVTLDGGGSSDVDGGPSYVCVVVPEYSAWQFRDSRRRVRSDADVHCGPAWPVPRATHRL